MHKHYGYMMSECTTYSKTTQELQEKRLDDPINRCCIAAERRCVCVCVFGGFNGEQKFPLLKFLRIDKRLNNLSLFLFTSEYS